MTFSPRFTITNEITAALTTIERARGFLEGATLSEDWVRRMGQRALLLEAHHTTPIEGTQLSIEQAQQIWDGKDVPAPTPTTCASCSTTEAPSTSWASTWRAERRSRRGWSARSTSAW